jgi:hypothetical protein
MQRRRLLLLAIASSASLLATRPAHAQGWLSDRRYTEGIGIKAGDFEIHPGIGGEAGFDSNWFMRSAQAGVVNGNPVPAAIFRITPSIYISTLQAQRKEGDVNAAPPTVNFRFGASATYRAFIGDQDVINQNGIDGLSGALTGRADILPQRPFSVGIEAGYTRTLMPNAGPSANASQNFNRNLINAGLDFTVTPGGGTLDWKFGYSGNFTIFDTNTAPFNNLQNTVFTRGTWRFGPKTALISDTNFAFINYTQKSTAINGLLDSTPLRSRLGLNGLISPRFGLLAFLGYGGSFVQDTINGTKVANLQQYGFGYTDKSFPGIIGQLEGRFFLTANPAAEQNPANVSLSVSAISIGYARDFAQSYLGSFYGSDRGYLKFSYFFGGRALISLEGGAGAREYPNIFDNNGGQVHGSFVDPAIDATLFAEYRFSNTLGLNTTLKYQQEISSVSLPYTSGAFGMDYLRFEAYLGFRWFM